MLKLTAGFRSYLKNIVSKVQNTLHLEVRIDAGAPHTVIYTDFQFTPFGNQPKTHLGCISLSRFVFLDY